MSPTLPPSNSPTNSPTNAPTHSPTKSPTKLPTKEPTHSPTRAPTDAPTQSPTQSPTRTPTNSPTSAPNMYPIQTAEAIWIGYLYTERIFGRNMSYIVTANSSGFIGHLYITLNSDDINLEKKVTKSDIMWLKNISWANSNGVGNIGQNIPNIPRECDSNPINTPTFSPTISPTVSPTGEPSMSPTIAHNLSGGGICSLPQPMIILYVILITFFILLLFCWYARKNNMMTRIMNGDEQSLAISSDRYHSKYKSHYNGNKIKKMNNKSESRSKYNNKKVYMRGGNNDRDKHNKPFIGRKGSDRYVGDDDSDIEYNRKGSKVSSIDIGVPIGHKKNKMNSNNIEAKKKYRKSTRLNSIH
eukprot:209447_1